jgi:biopolymer transport protein ExbD
MRRRLASQLGSPHGSGGGIEAINVTPLIDVVMCLIIFFLIVGKLAADERTQIDLPTTTIGDAQRAEAGVIVSVALLEDASGQPASPVSAVFFVGDERFSDAAQIERALRDQVARALVSLPDGSPMQPAPAITPAQIARARVTIRADQRVPFEMVEPVLSACSALGIVRVEYAAQRADGQAIPAGGNP